MIKQGLFKLCLILDAVIFLSIINANFNSVLANDTLVYFYSNKGEWIDEINAWLSDNSESSATSEGLLTKGSGRFYSFDWDRSPGIGTLIEASVKVLECQNEKGIGLVVADGIHEEFVSFLSNGIKLSYAKYFFEMDTRDTFHTYSIVTKGDGISISVDGKLIYSDGNAFKKIAVQKQYLNQCGFGCASSSVSGSAIWKSVRISVSASLISESPISIKLAKCRIQEDTTILIQKNTFNTTAARLINGSIVVGNKISSDYGKSWSEFSYPLSVSSFEFSNNEIISLKYNTQKIGDGMFTTNLIRSTNGGVNYSTEVCTLYIPQAVGNMDDNGKPYDGPMIDHSIIELSDGLLLATMYGNFVNDTILSPQFPKEWHVKKYRTFIVRSTDRGKTWYYYSTVTADSSIGTQGPCEPCLLRLLDGMLLCAMRSGGDRKNPTPVYICISADYGKTWSKPLPITDRGVFPNLLRLSNGTILLTYGRPDNYLAFSEDNGKSWIHHTMFSKEVSRNYNYLIETESNKFLVIFSRNYLDESGNYSYNVYGKYFKVIN